MALTLLTPTGAVTQSANNIIMVRCKDYVGSSAGASVVSDALAVPGQAVQETQTIAVQTAPASPFGLYATVDDSVAITVADLPLLGIPDMGYEILVGLRTEGDPPSNALNDCTPLLYSGFGATVAVAYGDDDLGFYGALNWLPRKHVENYVLFDIGSWYPDDTSATNIVFRGWGVAGGDVAIYFDMVYMLPLLDDAGNYSPNIPLVFGSNGTLIYDDDNDVSSAPWLGKFSVLDWRFPWCDDNGGGLPDMQEADDESSSFQTGSGGRDPVTKLDYVAGTTHINSFTWISDDMTETSTQPGIGQWEWVAAQGYLAFNNEAFNFYDPGPNLLSSWRLDGSGTASCYIGANDEQSGDPVGIAYYGGVTPTSSDPSQNYPTIDVENGTFSCMFSWDTIQGSRAGVGVRRSPTNNAVDWHFILALLDVDAGGNVSLSVVFYTAANGTDPHSQYVIAGPVAVTTGYAGGGLWVKAEKRGYLWRARAWVDGDSEPSTWDIEGHEPLLYSPSAPGSDTFFTDYPWDDNWNDPDQDGIVYDPRSHNGSRWYPARPCFAAGVDEALPHMIITANDFLAEFDPGTGTPGDVQTKTLKYDDSIVIDATVAVPYGSHRVVEGLTATRHFNVDTTEDGFNIRVWKDSSFPDLTPAIVGTIWERATTLVVGSIKFP